MKLLLCIVLIALVGCSAPIDPSEASNENFAKVVGEYYAGKKACFVLNNTFPYIIQADNANAKKTAARLDALVDATLLTKTSTGNKSEVKYSLTKTGKRDSKPGQGKASSKTKFCYGDYEIVEVSSFTKPRFIMDKFVTRVTHTFRVHNVASWAKTASLGQQLPYLKMDIATLDKPAEVKATLLKRNEVWIHRNLI